MHDLVTDVAHQRAAILAEALADTIAELRLIEPGDIIGYMRAGQWGSLADLVHSSTELFFRDGTLIFACAGEFILDWSSLPSIALEMEFQTSAVSAFFTLFLDRDDGMVALRDVWFASEPDRSTAGTAILQQAIADAQLAPRAVRPLAARPR